MNESQAAVEGTPAPAAEPTLAVRLRERWKTPHGIEVREKILARIKEGAAPHEWAPLLEGIPLIDSLVPHEGELFPRDLRGFDFSHTDLSHVEFSHTSFDYADFDHAHLERTRMRGCSFVEANFKRAVMHKTHLWNSYMQNARLAYADLTEADMGDVNLHGADLWWARMDEVNLRGADLSQANLRWARLPVADLWGANLDGAKFEGTNLSGIKVNEETNWGLTVPSLGKPLTESLRLCGAALHHLSVSLLASSLREIFWSFVQILYLVYWGRPTPCMKLEANAKSIQEYKIARDVYRQVYEACKSAGLREEAGWFFYRSQVSRRHSEFKVGSPGWFLEYMIFDCISGYGERPRWVIAAMGSVMVFFGFLNWFGGVHGALIYNGQEFRNIGFFGGLYFSIVAFTTVGFGDIIPNHMSLAGQILRFANVTESLLGALLMSLALVTYTRIAIRD